MNERALDREIPLNYTDWVFSTRQRLAAGYCPSCGRLLAIFNEYGVWPLVECSCGWHGGIPEMEAQQVFEPLPRMAVARADRRGKE